MKRKHIALIVSICLIISLFLSSYALWAISTSQEEKGPFYGSSQGSTYHYPWCSYVNKTKPENLMTFNTALEADIHGYHPCDICDPPQPYDPHYTEIITGLMPAYFGLIISIVALVVTKPKEAESEKEDKKQETPNNEKTSRLTILTPSFKIQKTIGIILVAAFMSAPMLGCVQAQGQYVGSIDSDVYHLPSCNYAKQINPENRIWFASEQEAVNKGYRPCSVCLSDSPYIPEMPLAGLIAVAATVSSFIILAKNKKIFQKNLL